MLQGHKHLCFTREKQHLRRNENEIDLLIILLQFKCLEFEKLACVLSVLQWFLQAIARFSYFVLPCESSHT